MKEKIAITIEDKLLARLDRAVDGETIRNRSHAIEYFLNQALGSNVRKAIILAGQKNSACLVDFEGSVVLERQLRLLANCGVEEVFLLVGSCEDRVRAILKDGLQYGLRIRYIQQREGVIGTGYALRMAKKFVGDEPFFALYCDVVAKIDLADFASYHAETGAVGTVALTSIADPSLYGSVKMRGEKIVGFEEKPKGKEGVSRVISAGIFCFSPEIFEYIPNKKQASLEHEVFPELAKEGKLAGYLFEGEWCNVQNQICRRAVQKKEVLV